MAKKRVTDHGIGKYGIAVEMEDMISNNWFETEFLRDQNFNRLKSSSEHKIKKIKRSRG